MPIISRVEARSFRGRLLYAGIIALLTIGGLTMVYPFVIMISGSLRSPMDESEMSVVPAFVVDKDVLYQKFLEYKYNEDIVALSQIGQFSHYSFDTVTWTESQMSPEVIQAFREYMQRDDIPPHWVTLGGTVQRGGVPANLRELRNRLKGEFNNDLAKLSFALGSPAESWLTFTGGD